MKKTFFVSPTTKDSGVTSISLGLVQALQSIGINAGFYKPISPAGKSQDRSIIFAREIMKLDPPPAIPLSNAQEMVNDNKEDLLLEKVVANYLSIKQQYDIIVVEGVPPNPTLPYTTRINRECANYLDSEVILVSAPNGSSNEDLNRHIELSAGLFASPEDPDVLGVILNKIGDPSISDSRTTISTQLSSQILSEVGDASDYTSDLDIFNEHFKLIGCVPWDIQLTAPRTSDLFDQLPVEILHRGDIEKRRVKQVHIASAATRNTLAALKPGALIVVSGDREDIILAVCMAAMSGVELAGMLLCDGMQIDERVKTFCIQALSTGLPVLVSQDTTYEVAHQLATMNCAAPEDDLERMSSAMNLVSQSLDLDWLDQQCKAPRAQRLSPPAFRHQLSESARAANKTIVLPEGNEPRTICAAAICHERDLAKCILIGKPEEIRSVAKLQDVVLPDDLKILDPDTVREDYVAPMVELRKSKGLTPQMALAQLEDNVVLGTMMVALDEVDGLVSGAVNTTANTVRPAFQLIKTAPSASIVSSVFFMCLPEQVLVYGDCAINPDPNAEQLADIAIQSAESARAFGIEPKVAMISYSTGTSGHGDDVDKVREATQIAKAKRPDLIIDGPLQYDAASVAKVAKKKAPDSPVAGQATVFIFPDLNTGNTTYKAVQRSANIISVGPMLQGLRKPVNDLSRGALIEDIVFTIALTAVQATQIDTN